MRKLAVFFAVLFFATPAWAQDLAPHRAAYSLLLGDNRGQVTSLEGLLAIDWSETCQGYALNQRMRFSMATSEEGAVVSDIVFSSLESKDGKNYRFSLRTTRDGNVVEELRGRAVLDPDKGGKAFFSTPELEMDLPPGTMFPTAHSLLLLNLAEGGERVIARAVFDGATLDGALDVTAFVSNKLAAEAPLGARTPPIGNRPFWRVRMAYFNPDDKTGTPQYETSMRMLDNAVATEYTFEYPEFGMRAKLERLEAVPKPNC
jgi:EipB-like